ncbi:envelope glycoprotein H [Colobine gammaherpesvirus 1]|uniref:Envelope glycoprotein H n=1 Tax=Colobine gammaherpesvirus 1 TaxID=2597325 RepID=A0A5B8G5C5_9GAMA|nr:envelope glycoprotein H [Colobine gammaherpesvirus 1]QDQ69230.1 envelope glycoprotein H [Colobine gammaherpesvirus 1]
MTCRTLAKGSLTRVWLVVACVFTGVRVAFLERRGDLAVLQVRVRGTAIPDVPVLLARAGGTAIPDVPVLQARVGDPALPDAPASMALSADRGNITVVLEYNDTCFTLNWNTLLESVTESVINQLWTSSHVVEDLGETLRKKKRFWRVSAAPEILPGHESRYPCVSPESHPRFNLTVNFNYSSLPGYLGDFSVEADGLLDHVFSSVWSVDPATHREYDMFYVMRLAAFRFFAILGDQAPGLRIMGYVSREFVIVTLVNQTADGNERGSHLLFGFTEALPSLAGYITYPEVVVAQNSRFALAVMVPAYAQPVLGENLTDLFLEVTLSAPDDFIRATQGRIMLLEAQRQCASALVPWKNLVVFFRVAIAHFLVFSGLDSHAFVRADCVCRQVADLDFLLRVTGLCFPTLSVGGYGRAAIQSLAAAQIHNLPSGVLASLPLQSLETVLSMFKLGRSDHTLPAVIVDGLERIADQMYTSYSYVYSLGERNRRRLLDIYQVLTANQSALHETDDRKLLLTFMRFTSMCTSLEIAEMVSRFAKPDVQNVYTFFSPCFLSLRYDLSHEKLLFQAPQTSRITRTGLAVGISGFWELLHDLHLNISAVLPQVNCTRAIKQDVIATLHLEHVTYVISPDPLPDAKVYEISEIFLKSAMYISALKHDCSNFETISGAARIPIVYNITAPRSGCPLCHSVVLSYDERQGLQSLMYITNSIVQANVFRDNSPFFSDDNLHVHYLWLMDNGTVLEIRGLYRRRAASVIYVLLLFLVIVSSLYFVYRLFSMLF